MIWEILKWPLFVALAIMIVYTLCRVGSSAVFRSWWESKVHYEKGGYRNEGK